MQLKPWNFLLFALTLQLVSASAGDRLPEFKECVSACMSTVCDNNPPRLPFYLTALFWDCPQDCDYECQRKITTERNLEDKEILQFHGKWPFKRFLGIQEPASVVFSILNFIPHYHAIFELRKKIPENDARSNYYLKNFYLVVPVLGMNAWIWSSVFHCRDFRLTERLDYFSAGLYVMTGFYFGIVRIFRLDRIEHARLLHVFTVACIVAVASHISYLSLIKFSYSYNMIANVSVGVLQNLIWCYYSISQYFFVQASSRQAWKLWPIANVILLTFAMSLELFDFPPLLDAIDAHSLWHAATIIPSYWWYEWMKKDAEEVASIKSRRT
ncbi:Per1-like protein [Lipomyces japonicus]|uniref:Per1-like protein n=1 Tax=Lipomyces japonicus TaxID=56871 RepID=UPI0034CDA962